MAKRYELTEAQFETIRDLLPEAGKGRVGTVDKFQGQEAAVSIYSMTTSSSVRPSLNSTVSAFAIERLSGSW